MHSLNGNHNTINRSSLMSTGSSDGGMSSSGSAGSSSLHSSSNDQTIESGSCANSLSGKLLIDI